MYPVVTDMVSQKHQQSATLTVTVVQDYQTSLYVLLLWLSVGVCVFATFEVNNAEVKKRYIIIYII